MRKFARFAVAFDKFKDCLNASQLCELTGKGLQKALGDDIQFTPVPLADGGDGFLESIEYFFENKQKGSQMRHKLDDYNLSRIQRAATGPLGKKIDTSYLFLTPRSDESGLKPISFVEQGLVSGLQQVPIKVRHPFKTNCNGTGELILDSYQKGAREIYLGVGGSATVDFGIGALQALGVKFFDVHHKEVNKGGILTGGDIAKIEDMEFTEKKLYPDMKLHLICDVNNPLLGKKGAAYVYGKQKGAKESELPMLEGYMKKMADIVKRKSRGRICLHDMPKAGAAGGIVSGLYSTLNCEFHSGIEFVADLLGLEQIIRESDAVVTGEGAFDYSTLEGKTVSHVIKLAKQYDKKLIVICGLNRIGAEDTKKLGIDVYDLVSRFDKESCFKKTESCIQKMIMDEIKQTLT